MLWLHLRALTQVTPLCRERPFSAPILPTEAPPQSQASRDFQRTSSIMYAICHALRSESKWATLGNYPRWVAVLVGVVVAHGERSTLPQHDAEIAISAHRLRAELARVQVEHD